MPESWQSGLYIQVRSNRQLSANWCLVINPQTPKTSVSRGSTLISLSLVFLSLIFSVGCSEREDADPAAEEPTGERSNLLFIIVDDLNDWTGHLGGHPQAQTPNLDRLAESGAEFTYAYANHPVCGPSRTAMLYGRYAHETGAYGSQTFYSPETLARYGAQFGNTVVPDIFSSQKSIATAFRENGYYTVGAGKLSHFTTHYASDDIASYFQDDFDEYFNSGDRVFPDPENPESEDVVNHLSFGPVAPEEEEDLLDNRFTEWGVEQIKEERDQPFFLALGLKKPHQPWVAPQSYFDQYDLEDIELPEVPGDDLEDVPHAGRVFAQSLFGLRTLRGESYPVTEHEYISSDSLLWKRMVRAYLASTSYVDAMIGKVLDALEESPHAENTIVALVGDHGWHLGEKEHWRKMTLWERGTRVPMIIRRPGASANGQSIGHPVTLQDIYPTLADLADLEINQKLNGHSLAPLLEEPEQEWDKPALMSHGPGNFAVRSGPWRYIRYQNGDEELYNIEEDPGEFANLAAQDGYEEVTERLSQHIPEEHVTLYSHRFMQFANIDTMEIFIDRYSNK